MAAVTLAVIATFWLVILVSPPSDSQYDPPWLTGIRPKKIQTEVREDLYLGKDRFVMEKYWLVDEPLKDVVTRLDSTYRDKDGFSISHSRSTGDVYIGTGRRLTSEPGYSINAYKIGDYVRIQVSMVREATWVDKLQSKLRKIFVRK